MNRKQFQKKKEREREVRKRILARREKLRVETKQVKKSQQEEAAATTKHSLELDKLMEDLKKIGNV
jgi:hypothetical protein